MPRKPDRKPRRPLPAMPGKLIVCVSPQVEEQINRIKGWYRETRKVEPTDAQVIQAALDLAFWSITEDDPPGDTVLDEEGEELPPTTQA